MTSDSRDNSFIRNTWLPGGIMSAVWGKCQKFIEEESIYSDKMGQQNGFKMTNRVKFILFVTAY